VCLFVDVDGLIQGHSNVHLITDNIIQTVCMAEKITYCTDLMACWIAPLSMTYDLQGHLKL